MSREGDLAKMAAEKAELKEALYDILNQWMLREDCRREPDMALGIAVGALAEAGGDYSAAYRFINALSDEWSLTYVQAVSKVFANQHFVHLEELIKTVHREDGQPVKTN